MRTEYLQAGYLVVGGISQRGCVSYQQDQRKEERKGDELDAEWRTKKHVQSQEEQAKVMQTRSKLSRNISQLGTHIAGFGYLIPVEKGPELEEQIQYCKEAVREYNAEATCTQLFDCFAVFEVKATDERIAIALYNKAITILEGMNKSIEKGDIKALRSVMNQARGLDSMLPDIEGEQLNQVLAKARESAKEATRQMKDEFTEDSSTTIVERVMKKSEAAVDGLRASFVETSAEMSQKTVAYVPVTDVRQLD